jgi:anaerobic selenocysteine-containing dehydrogenase
MVKLGRRTFLKLAGASAAAGTLYRLGLTRLSHQASSEDQFAGPPSDRRILGTCRLCAAGCGLSARVVDGRVVKLDGNPFHPNNEGKLCPKGQAGLQVLYDPDRIKGPMRRVGEGWQQISWEEALSEIADALQALRDSGHPERMAFLHDGKRGPTSDLIARFCRVFGTPNDVRRPRHSADGTPLAHLLSQGWNDHAAYDWENTDYLLCFGGAFLEAWQPLVRHLRAYARMRRGRPGRRAKIVQIEPRASVTATKADEWIPINPGTEGALALGIAHVIVRDETYDASFLAEHTFGFEDWTDEEGNEHVGFRTLVLQDYSPDRVARITGVDAETIERIAREFAATKPAVAAGDVSGYTNSLYSQWAVHALNALVGSIERPGGVMRQMEPPLAPWPEFELDEIAVQGLAQPRVARGERSLAAEDTSHALTQAPYPIDILFLYHSNPIYDDPPGLDWAATIEDIPLVVSFSPYLDETSERADLLLPDCTYLEKWFLEPLEPSLGYPAVGLGRPVVDPLYDTRNIGDALIELAQAAGDPLVAAMPWSDFVEAIREQARGLYEAGVGMPSGARPELAEGKTAEAFEAFWADLVSRAVWYDEPYTFEQWEHAFDTPSGKFEFASHTLQERLTSLDVSFEDEDLLPRYEEPAFEGDGTEYPFHLRTFKPITYTERWPPNIPWLQEIYGLHVQEKWGNWVELNPETAHELGIHDGDLVRVESPQGGVELKARLWPGTPPEVVSIPLGQGHIVSGRWAEKRGVNPNEIIAPLTDRMSGELATQSTRVRVRKV